MYVVLFNQKIRGPKLWVWIICMSMSSSWSLLSNLPYPSLGKGQMPKIRNASKVFYNKIIPIRLKGLYCMGIKLTLLYGLECWLIKKSLDQRMMVAKMRII